jgi:hypothetical protein
LPFLGLWQTHNRPNLYSRRLGLCDSGLQQSLLLVVLRFNMFGKEYYGNPHEIKSLFQHAWHCKIQSLAPQVKMINMLGTEKFLSICLALRKSMFGMAQVFFQHVWHHIKLF